MSSRKVPDITSMKPKRRPFWPGALMVWLVTGFTLVSLTPALPVWTEALAAFWGWLLGFLFVKPGMKP